MDAAVFEQFARQQSVAPAQHQDVARILDRGQGAGRHGLVVADFVQAGELQLAVQEQAEIAAVLREDDLLVGGLFVDEDGVAVGLGVDGPLQIAGAQEKPGQRQGGRRAQRDQFLRRPQLNEYGDGDDDVERRHQVGAAHEAELGE